MEDTTISFWYFLTFTRWREALIDFQHQQTVCPVSVTPVYTLFGILFYRFHTKNIFILVLRQYYKHWKERRIPMDTFIGELHSPYVLNMTTVISKHFRMSIFRKSFAWKWLGLKNFFQFFEMEELGASDAHQTEILDYDIFKI